MDEHRAEMIRQRAYDLWCRAGCPDGQDHEHWEQATREIEAEDAASRAAAPDEPPSATAGAAPASAKPDAPPGSRRRVA